MGDRERTQSYPYSDLAENILGSPLHLDKPAEVAAGRSALRAKAYEIVVDAVQYYTGRDLGDGRMPHLSPEEKEVVIRSDDIRFLVGELAVANSLAQHNTTFSNHNTRRSDNPTTARAQFQANVTSRMFDHAQTWPESVSFDPNVPLRQQLNSDGLVTIAPTGAGKTVIEATLLRHAGLGSRDPVTGRIRRGLLVTSTQQLVGQFIGESGDNTFCEFLGNDIPVTPFYGKKKDKSGLVHITTPQSLHYLNLSDYVALAVDEGHKGLAPKMLEGLGTFGLRPYLFTATPAYNRRRDLRNYYAHIENGSLFEFIDRGILNRARILSFSYDDNPELFAASLAHTYIKNGRRVVVYCQPGGESLQARVVAGLINQMSGSTNDIARSVGKHNTHNEIDERAFDEGQLRALTTCKRLREGWNAQVDVVIAVGPNYSLLDLEQKIGRALRPGKFVSELVELIPSRIKRSMASIWNVMGLEMIVEDLVLGPSMGELTTSGQRKVTKRKSNNSEPQPLPLYKFTHDQMARLITKRPVRSILLGGREYASQGAVSILDLAEKYEVPVRWLQRKLDEKGFSYEGVWGTDNQADGTRDFTRWYCAEAATYLEENPPLRLARADEMHLNDLASLCEVSTQYLKTVIAELGITPKIHLTRRSQETGYYDFESIVSVVMAIESIPVASEDEATTGMLYEECSKTFVDQYLERNKDTLPFIRKRRNPRHGSRGICVHFEAAIADQIREAYKESLKIPIAGDDYTGYYDIARRAEVTYDTLVKNLTDEEKAIAKVMRGKQGIRSGLHMPKEIADQIVDRLKPYPLPAHLVYAPIFDTRVAHLKSRLSRYLREIGEQAQMIRIKGQSRPTPCLTWEQLRQAEEKFGTRPGARKIFYDRVVRDEYDTDPERVAYSRNIQRTYVDADILATEPPQPVARPIEPIQRAPAPEAKLSPAPQPSSTPAPSLPIEAVAKEEPIVSSDESVPDTTVDLVSYLADNGITCAPSLALRLLQHNKFPQPKIKDEKLWVSGSTASRLEKMITTAFPIASIDMMTPEAILLQFPNHRLRPLHIVHLAAELRGAKTKHARIYRGHPQGLTPGVLAIYYDAQLSNEIIKTLYNPGEVERLRRLGRI